MFVPPILKNIGITNNKELFIVQIKEYKKTNRKYLMSVFPLE